MFERYPEKARRVIFFARYEVSQFGSPVIETEHLLLGILRDDAPITRMLPAGAPETTRAQIDAPTEIRERVSTSLDLRLSNASKRLLREEDSLAAKLLEPFGVNGNGSEQKSKSWQRTRQPKGSGRRAIAKESIEFACA